jgi:RNA polymerase sigma factor (sigma-70 family)
MKIAYGEDREGFILENQKLVHSIIRKRYGNVVQSKIAEYDDLVQIGTMGLILAYDKFDLAFKCRFSTYASIWIVRELSYFLVRHDHYVHFPRQAKENWFTIVKMQLEDDPPEEIAKQLGLSLRAVKVAFEYSVLRVATSLSSHPYADDDICLEEVIGQEDDLSGSDIQAFIQSLPLSKKKIVMMRIKDCSQDQIATKLGFSQVKIGRDLKRIRAEFDHFKLNVR